MLPGGRGVLFRLAPRRPGPGRLRHHGEKLPNGPAHALTRGIYARYVPSGHLLVVTADGKLIAMPFDPDKLELTGSPVALIEGIGVRAGGFNVDLSLSRTGTLVYTTGSTLGSRRAFWVSRDGKAAPVEAVMGPAGRHSERRALARWEGAGGRVVAGRQVRHLGQAASHGSVLPNHLRGHRERAAWLVAGRPRGVLRQRPDRHGGGWYIRPEGGRYGRRAPG